MYSVSPHFIFALGGKSRADDDFADDGEEFLG